MDPGRRRKVRLIAFLGVALLLSGALMYTSFAGANPAQTPGQLAGGAQPGRSYQLTGTVAHGSLRHQRGGISFRVRDRGDSTSVPVRYSGAIPEPFREGREIIVTVRREGTVFVGEHDSLVTKCPSKFTAKRGA